MSRTNEANEHQLLDLLAQHGSLGNGKAREHLGWGEESYKLAKEGLYAQGLVAFGPGRGGTIQLANGKPNAKPGTERGESARGTIPADPPKPADINAAPAHDKKPEKETTEEPIEKQLWKNG
jgi:hypothetical protein